jgi:hypothetical protein
MLKAMALATLIALLPVAISTSRADNRDEPTSSPDTVLQWDEIAANTVVKSGAFQNEGLIYMAYVSSAVYDAVTSIEGHFRANGPKIRAPRGASADAAVVEAAYRTLIFYFPAPRAAGSPDLDALYSAALAALPATSSTAKGIAVGLQAANDIIASRATDGRQTPIGVTSLFPLLPPDAGVWRRSPPAFGAPQTPWVGDVQTFILRRPDQFLPPPPPSLASTKWANAFEQIKSLGDAASTTRTQEQTDIAKFWTANVILQYNRALRDLAVGQALDLVDTARLMAMVNIVGADAQISVMNAKYHYLFWRPVTAIDPTSVTADGLGPTLGFDDGNPATAELTGWRPLLTTPTHPEYPAAHGSLTSAMAEVFSQFLDTPRINIDIHGFDPNGTAGNLDAVRHFDTTNDLRDEIINARLWGGLHYTFSTVAGVNLGRRVAKYDLRHAFQRLEHDD